MAEPQATSQLHERHHVRCAGPHLSLPPAPYRVGKSTKATGDLGPRQTRLFLEPTQPIREVVGESMNISPVVYALSRHGAALSMGLVGSRSRPIRPSVRPSSRSGAACKAQRLASAGPYSSRLQPEPKR